MRGAGWWLALAAAVLLTGVVAIAAIWRGDILRALLDPQTPFVVTRPPAAPNYETAGAWARLPVPDGRVDPKVDVFFVHPTTFNGGRSWNGSISNRKTIRTLDRAILPNYAAPFAKAGRVFAPRYRQASLYTSFTLFDDALLAREFAYGDVRKAFRVFRDGPNRGRPFILVGVEQGGLLAARLLSEEIAGDPPTRKRLVAAYLAETLAPADEHGPTAAIPACSNAAEIGCLLAWTSVWQGDFMRGPRLLSRALVWDRKGRLVGLGERAALCVNPLIGRVGDDAADRRHSRGAANATGLEWGLEPAFLTRAVGAQCVGGLLRVSRPRSRSLRPPRDWVDRFKVPPYNLFWADLEADAARRSHAFLTAGALECVACWRTNPPPISGEGAHEVGEGAAAVRRRREERGASALGPRRPRAHAPSTPSGSPSPTGGGGLIQMKTQPARPPLTPRP